MWYATQQGEIGDTAVYEGKVYGFCGTGCKDEFVKSPTQYPEPTVNIVSLSFAI